MSVTASPPVRPAVPSAASNPTAPGGVTGAIRRAAKATGTSFNYPLATARIESDLNPNLTMRSSSATGLFQFIEQTWLSTLKQSGGALGYGRYAKAIEQTKSGRYVVKDPALRTEILKLRKDPVANAAMAGAFTQQNAARLSKRIGRAPNETELYIAHFFGPGGAGKLIDLAKNNPGASAVDAFPRAAGANRTIFYDKQGNARSIAGVYAEFDRRYQVARAGPLPGVAPPSVVAKADPVAAPAVPDTAGITGAFAAVGPSDGVLGGGTGAGAGGGGSGFHSLFHTAERRSGVSRVVADLWTVSGDLPPKPMERPPADAQNVAGIPTAPAPAKAAPLPANASNAARPLDLFQDLPPDARALFDGRV